jgi:hypothetical protein
MHGAVSDHPLVADLDTTDPLLGQTLDAFEALLGDLEAAVPDRIAGKRTEFRRIRDEQSLLNLRTEMAMGAKLSRSGIAFDFGRPGEPSPDLHLRDRNFAIEVTAKTPSGVPHLYDELEAALQELSGASVHLRFTNFPIRMQQVERTRLIEGIVPVAVRAAATGVGGVAEITFDDSRNPGPITVAAEVLPVPALGIYGLPITMESTGPLLGPTMTAIENVVLAILDDPRKRRQGLSMPAVLLIDLARLGNAWLRPLDEWAARLARSLPQDCPYVAMAVTIADLHQVDIPLGVAMRPTATEAQRARVKCMIDHLSETSAMPATLRG